MARFTHAATVIFRERDYKKLREEARRLDTSMCALLRTITVKHLEQKEQEGR